MTTGTSDVRTLSLALRLTYLVALPVVLVAAAASVRPVFGAAFALLAGSVSLLVWSGMFAG